MADVQANTIAKFNLRYSAMLADDNVWLAAISWILTGQSYAEKRTIKIGIKNIALGTLVACGLMQTIQRPDGITTSIPFLYLVLREHQLIPQEFHYFWNRLRDPTNTFNWKEFETLSCMHQIMRLEAFLACGMKEVSITHLFAGATCYNVDNATVTIRKKAYVQLLHRWPGTKVWPTILGQLQIEGPEMLGYIFGNADGAPADAIDLYQVVSIQEDTPPNFILIAHQNKFICAGKTELKAKDILHEWQKMTSAVKKARGDYDEVDLFMKRVSIVLFFFTNRYFAADIGAQVAELWNGDPVERPHFIITRNIETYLGPFKSVIQSFNTA